MPTIMIVRHAEKPGECPGAGVGADGTPDKHSLTVGGWARAGALVQLLASRRHPPPDGLSTPDAIYASLGEKSHSLRSPQTVQPLAARLGITVDTSFGKGQEAELGAELAGRDGVTLVVWQHEYVRAILDALGPVTPEPPADWPDDRFDVVYAVTATNSGWRFTQVPQLLMDGDSPEPF